MRYVCLGYMEEKRWHAMTAAEHEAFVGACTAYDDELRAKGHLVGGEALKSVQTATTLRVQGGKVALTDGPFAETREQLGGIIILEANDLNQALQLMSHHPSLRFGCAFEVRPTESLAYIYSLP